MTAITLTVNGKAVSADVAPRTHLADFLREALLLTGTHIGCEHGICGACTVEINGELARSCITYAVACDGAEVRTIESFDDDAVMAELRAAFTQQHALQCGYCTPGMLIAARDLWRRKGKLQRHEIRREMSGNLCRCTGYMGIINAIEQVMTDGKAPRAAGAPRAAAAPASGWLGPAPGPQAAPPVAKAAAAAPPAPGERAARPARVAADDRRRRLRAPVIKVTAARIQERDGHTALSQRFVLEHPQAAVWDLLGDIPRLARCMPGVSLDGPPEAGRVSGFLDVKLGPITARFAGQGEVNLRPAEQRLRLEGRGVDRKGGSNVSGSVDCRLEPTTGAGGAAATAVHLDLAYALSGPLAQIARGGLVHDLARRLAQMFAQNMDAQLRHADAAPSVAALSGLALLLQITRDRLARWLRTLLGRPT